MEGKRENMEAQIRSKYFIGNSRIMNKNITFLKEWDLARDKRALLPVEKPPAAPMLKGHAGNPSICDRVRPPLSIWKVRLEKQQLKRRQLSIP